MAKPTKKKKPSKPAKAKAKARPAKKLAAKSAAKKKAAPRQRPVVARVPAAKPDARRRPKSLMRRASERTMRPMPHVAPRPRGGKYDTDLDRNPANFQSLTPLTYLERAASVFPNR